MELRLVGAALRRYRGTLALALAATAIGTALASTLLHIQAGAVPGVAAQLSGLGPNLVIVPRGEPGTSDLDGAAATAELEAAGIRDAVPVLYTVASLTDATVPVAGTDLPALRGLHPAWEIHGDAPGSAALIGARLARRLGIAAGARLVLHSPAATVETAPVALLAGGGAEEDLAGVPIEDARRLAERPGRASLFQARVAGGGDAVARAERALAPSSDLHALPLTALDDAERRLLDRTRRLLSLLTLATLVAACLCTLGTLTDLALERRRDIALLSALGATRRDVVRLLAAESVALGLAGGLVGWALGAALAAVVGRAVFGAPIAPRWETLPVVLALALAVAVVAAIGPARLVLRLEPAPALQGDG